MTPTIQDIVAEAIKQSLINDEDSNAWMDATWPLEDFTIDGSVNLSKVAQAALTAIEQAGYVVVPKDGLAIPADLG